MRNRQYYTVCHRMTTKELISLVEIDIFKLFFLNNLRNKTNMLHIFFLNFPLFKKKLPSKITI